MAPAPAVLEAPEIAGHRNLWAAAPADLAERHGIAHADVAGAHCAAVGSLPESRLLTHALGLEAAREDAVDAVERFYAERGLRALAGVPEGAPAEALLRARGYGREYPWVKFWRDTAPAAPVDCELRIAPVTSASSEAMGALVAAAFGLPEDLAAWLAAIPGRPGWHCLGAFDGGELAGTGSLFADGRAGWLTWGATHPAHRGRRAQKALLAARIDLARELGLRLLVTETGEVEDGRPDASHRNILGAGFRRAFRRPFWRAPAAG